MDMVVDLINKLRLRQPFNGCMRRNKWDLRAPKYSLVKGNAVLLQLGAECVTIDTPVGPSDHMVIRGRDSRVILFRAGPWRSYWLDDARQEIELLRAGGFPVSEIALIAHENQGDLVLKEVDLGDHSLHYTADVEELTRKYNSNTRIPKNTERALRICRSCPVKSRCDGTDREQGETGDWHPQYPFP